MKGSLIIIGCFLVGILVGIHGWAGEASRISDIGFYVLCALMLMVGISMGSDPEIFKKFRHLNPRLALLPFTTIAGTLTAAALVGVLLPHRTITDTMAVGAGMGYYSLSSIFITTYKGAELGTVALISNIIRELITLLLTPILVKYFSKLAPIAAGGATTMDTTLPIITRYSGQSLVIVSIFHGFVTDFSVPFLVTFLCSI